MTDDETTTARRNLVTARVQLQIAVAVAAATYERHPGDRTAATEHAAQLRAGIPALIAECAPCATCGKDQTVETLTR